MIDEAWRHYDEFKCKVSFGVLRRDLLGLWQLKLGRKGLHNNKSEQGNTMDGRHYIRIQNVRDHGIIRE